ncbi:unnamed protein product [Penicillium glandicola]
MNPPEEYYIEGTPYVPGSALPVLVWRGALAHCETEDDMKDVLEANGGWVKGIAAGSSELSIGRGPLDNASLGKLITVSRGDCMAIPAGISHCSSTATIDYRYVVLFPKGEPKWISIWCDDATTTEAYKKECLRVPMPVMDPLGGPEGFLVTKWKAIASST